MLIYIIVLAHACAWEEMINYNRIDSYDTVTIGHSYKNINVKMISLFFHVHSCANLYYCISTCLCLGRNDQLQQNRLLYTVTTGHSYKNINVKMISICFHVHTCANLYYCISTCLCLGRNDQLQQNRLLGYWYNWSQLQEHQN